MATFIPPPTVVDNITLQQSATGVLSVKAVGTSQVAATARTQYAAGAMTDTASASAQRYPPVGNAASATAVRARQMLPTGTLVEIRAERVVQGAADSVETVVLKTGAGTVLGTVTFVAGDAVGTVRSSGALSVAIADDTPGYVEVTKTLGTNGSAYNWRIKVQGVN